VYICLCNAITERQIIRRRRAAPGRRKDLASGLGVGLGCGSCVSCAKALLVEAVARITPPSGKLAPSFDGDAS
jgi:bacterioferritin-associated ferredoxin